MRADWEMSRVARAEWREMKQHGCERPFHNLQIASWLFFVVFFLAFYLVFYPALSKTKRTLSQIAILLSCLVVIALDLICVFSNPTDPIVLKE